MGQFVTPDVTWPRVDVLCMNTETDGSQLEIITGTPGRLVRIPPIPPRFLIVGYAFVPPGGLGPIRLQTERDPSWVETG